jgi:hypothetical protein
LRELELCEEVHCRIERGESKGRRGTGKRAEEGVFHLVEDAASSIAEVGWR